MSPGTTVFVVDDDASVRMSLTRLLRSVGYDVEAIASADEFLRLPPTRTPGCLILDLQLPGINGLDLQRALTESDQQIPIIFISGHGSISASVQAMKKGAVDFLTKPFDEKELLEAVARASAQEQLHRKKQSDERSARWRAKQLTPRERQVMQYVISGRLNKQIAQRLGISEKTVKVHRGRVVEKMHATSVVDLVRLAEKAGLAPAR